MCNQYCPAVKYNSSLTTSVCCCAVARYEWGTWGKGTCLLDGNFIEAESAFKTKLAWSIPWGGEEHLLGVPGVFPWRGVPRHGPGNSVLLARDSCIAASQAQGTGASIFSPGTRKAAPFLCGFLLCCCWQWDCTAPKASSKRQGFAYAAGGNCSLALWQAWIQIA